MYYLVYSHLRNFHQHFWASYWRIRTVYKYPPPLAQGSDLKILGSPVESVFLIDPLRDRDSVYSREISLETLGTPVKSC